MRHIARTLAAPTVLAAGLLLAGCGSDSTVAEDPASDVSPTTSTSAAPSQTPSESPVASSSESATEPPGDATTGDTLITLDSPVDGAKVSGSFTAKGTANAPEANVPWRILAGDKVVAEGYATAEGWMDKLYPYETAVDVSKLAPGDYTFVVEVPDLSDGEGNGPQTVERHISVG